ncbi:hypothetical protein D3C73_386680 [compost metagenome]
MAALLAKRNRKKCPHLLQWRPNPPSVRNQRYRCIISMGCSSDGQIIRRRLKMRYRLGNSIRAPAQRFGIYLLETFNPH